MATHLERGRSYDSYIGPGNTLYSFLTPLQALDGDRKYTRLLCRLPYEADYDAYSRQDLEAAREQFIQAAGSASGMTVEIRKTDDDGATRLYTVGRAPLADTTTPPTVRIKVGEHSTNVYPNEVFAAAEAAGLFFHYYLGDRIPDGYVLRDLNFV